MGVLSWLLKWIGSMHCALHVLSKTWEGIVYWSEIDFLPKPASGGTKERRKDSGRVLERAPKIRVVLENIVYRSSSLPEISTAGVGRSLKKKATTGRYRKRLWWWSLLVRPGNRARKIRPLGWPVANCRNHQRGQWRGATDCDHSKAGKVSNDVFFVCGIL